MLEINTCPVFVRAAILLNRALTGRTVTYYKGCTITNVVTQGKIVYTVYQSVHTFIYTNDCSKAEQTIRVAVNIMLTTKVHLSDTPPLIYTNKTYGIHYINHASLKFSFCMCHVAVRLCICIRYRYHTLTYGDVNYRSQYYKRVMRWINVSIVSNTMGR